jgi:TetR/AcrR family transcriptional regulator, regulator of cefoperazone and chloramphenicol sensitivity
LPPDINQSIDFLFRLMYDADMQASSREALPSVRSEATRAALVRAALDLFGDKGFEATSTREIAAAAGANIAAIAYHFGGKDGLRLACADFVVATISEIVASGLARAVGIESLSAEAARDLLARIVGALIDGVVARDAARSTSRFVLREMFEPSPAFERVYAGVMGPTHMKACAIWSRATGAPAESEETRLAVFAVLAQVLYFRIARPAVLRRMDWRNIGPSETSAIKRVVLANLDAALDLARKARS